MSPSQLPAHWKLAEFRIKDPGASGTINPGPYGNFAVELRTAAAESRTLKGPQHAHDVCQLVLNVDGGDCTVTVKDSAGSTTHTLVFNDAGDFALLYAIRSGTTLKWVVVAAPGTSGQASGTFTIPVTQFRVHDAMATALPATAANDDMGLITGTPGTDAPTLQGVDFGGTSTDEKGSFLFSLPPEYVAGTDLTVALRAGMVTGISDGTCTVDVEAWKIDGDGAVGSDLCATAAQSINSLTYATKSFTITGTSLSPGDQLVIRLSFAGSDVGNLVVMIPEVSRVQVVAPINL